MYKVSRNVRVKDFLDVLRNGSSVAGSFIQPFLPSPTAHRRQASYNERSLGHPMYLDITLDQVGPLRPTPRLANHRTPVRGLFISGAGTNPIGGIAGTPGRLAAQALLADRQGR